MSILLNSLITAACLSLSAGVLAGDTNVFSPNVTQGSVTTNSSSINGDITGQNLIPPGWTVNTGTQGQLVYTVQDSPYCKGCPEAGRMVNGTVVISGAG